MGKGVLSYIVIFGLVSSSFPLVMGKTFSPQSNSATTGFQLRQVTSIWTRLSRLLGRFTEVVVDGGKGYVGGSPAAPDVWAAAKSDMTIHIGRTGTLVVIKINYTISCPGSADDGYVYLEFTDHSQKNQTHSGDVSQGYLQIDKFFYPRESLGWKITVEYWDWWHGRLLASDSDTALGRTSPSTNILQEFFDALCSYSLSKKSVVAEGNLTVDS